MRYPPSHKAESREKLVRSSAALAKEKGFAVSGVDALTSAAGLTSGAFYRHFESKDELLADIVASELEKTKRTFGAIDGSSRDTLLAVVDAYLSLAHVRTPSAGCVLPTLSSEVGRAGPETKAAYERALFEVIAILTEKLGDRSLATAVVAQCAGAVMLARAMDSDAAKRDVLQAARLGVRRMIEA